MLQKINWVPPTWDPPIINKQIWFRWHPPWSSLIKWWRIPLSSSNTCIFVILTTKLKEPYEKYGTYNFEKTKNH